MLVVLHTIHSLCLIQANTKGNLLTVKTSGLDGNKRAEEKVWEFDVFLFGKKQNYPDKKCIRTAGFAGTARKRFDLLCVRLLRKWFDEVHLKREISPVWSSWRVSVVLLCPVCSLTAFRLQHHQHRRVRRVNSSVVGFLQLVLRLNWFALHLNLAVDILEQHLNKLQSTLIGDFLHEPQSILNFL